MKEIYNYSIVFFVFIISLSSCVTSHIYEDAQVIGKENHAMEGSLQRGFFTTPPVIQDNITRFYEGRDIGTGRFRYIYGAGDQTDISFGIDFPVGLTASTKRQFKSKSLRHIHACKLDVFLPLYYYLENLSERPVLSVSPSYIYTFRYDDLLSFSTNAVFLSTKTNQNLFHLPGIAAGIQVGDVLRFNAGVSYFNNFGFLGAENLQYLSVEAGIKFDLEIQR